jgi:glyoxylase-like metal-dependent hydrolase (beta-lactamase superfamily II)
MGDPGRLTWDVGTVRITRIAETEIRFSVAQMLRRQAPDIEPHADWAGPYLAGDGADLDVRLSVHSFGVEADGRRILVDTCVGNGRDFGTLVPGFNFLQTDFLDDLSAAGFGPADVDTVVCTHLHMDHVGWNTLPNADGGWEPTFPDARYVMTALDVEHWRHVTASHNVFDVSVQPLLERGLVDQVAPDHRVSASLRLVPTPGHTPGHVSVLVTSGDAEALVTGDMAHSPLELVEPAWGPAGEVDPEASVRSREEVARMVTDRGVLVLGTHFPPPTGGYVSTGPDGRRRFAP